MARINTDQEIDLNAITINVNGLVTDSTNKRGSAADSTDGFVYTISTKKAENGNYQYRYGDVNVNKFATENPLTYIDSATDDINRNIGTFRDASGTTFEGIIALKQIISSGKYDGSATAEGDFLYNEGNLGNKDSTPINATLDGDKAGINGTNNFYDTNTTAFSDQLTKVRNLTKSV